MKRLIIGAALTASIATPAGAQTGTPTTVYTAIINCAPHIDRGIVVGILQRESSVSPWQQLAPNSPNLWQINDNTEHRSYAFPSYVAAVKATEQRVTQHHHVVAIGIGQILSENLPQMQVSIADAFLPCTNLSLTQKVLWWGYRLATDTLHVPPGLTATHTALQLYYGGWKHYNEPDAIDYANDVMNRAASFNALANAPGPSTIANLPMPDHPWPAGANAIPYQPAASQTTTTLRTRPNRDQRAGASAAEAYRARLQARAAADQRRLNSFFEGENR